jgi:hypothetical protein
MFAALLVLCQAAIPFQEPPRLRTELPNGAVVLAQSSPGSERMAVQIMTSCRGVPDTFATQGRRHLLEHLIAKGRNGDLDVRLEAKGVFLRADTTRDVLRVTVVGPAGELDLALQAVSEVLPPATWSPAQVKKEAGIVLQELALLPDAALLSSAMWRTAFGDDGLDPIGRAEVVEATTPEQMVELHRLTFAGPNVLLSISGPLGVMEIAKKGADLLKALPKLTLPPLRGRPAGKPGRVEVKDAYGEARAAIAPGFSDPKTAAIMAAGFAIAGRKQGAYLIYTPTTQPGLVIVGQTDENNGLGLEIDEMPVAERAAFFEPAKNMTRQWYRQQVDTPLKEGRLRGILMLLHPGARPEDFLYNLEAMSQADFLKGFEAFTKAQAVLGVGVDR